jgi:hypothetical protein
MRPSGTSVWVLKLLVYGAFSYGLLSVPSNPGTTVCVGGSDSKTYADVCWRMLTCADVCWRMHYSVRWGEWQQDWCGRMLTYADVCWRMLTYSLQCELGGVTARLPARPQQHLRSPGCGGFVGSLSWWLGPPPTHTIVYSFVLPSCLGKPGMLT